MHRLVAGYDSSKLPEMPNQWKWFGEIQQVSERDRFD
jgi:hypothetical protein